MEEASARFLSDSEVELMFVYESFLEEFGDLLVAGIVLLFFRFSFVNVLQEKLVCLVVDLLRSTLGFVLHMRTQHIDPVYPSFLVAVAATIARHLNPLFPFSKFTSI